MLVSWIIYGSEGGRPRWFNGSSRLDDAWRQNPPPGWRQIVVPDGNTLESIVDQGKADLLRDAIWEAAKRQRSAVVNGKVETAHGTFQATAEARAAISRNASLAARTPGYTVEWTDADNAVVVLDEAALMDVDGMMVRHETAAHERAREIRGAIDAAATIDELLSIDFMIGWPD